MSVSEIEVGQATVPAVTIVRNLGTWFDMNLFMSTHLNNHAKLLFIICIILNALAGI